MRVQRVIVQEEKPKKGKKGALAGKPLIHIIIILDRSGSMDEEKWKGPTKYDNAIVGINQELQTLREDKTADYLITIIEFDQSGGTRIVTRFDKVPLSKIGTIAGLGTFGGTPLYETVGVTLRKYMKLVGSEKTLVKVFTDGGENASQGEWGRWYRGGKLLSDTIAKAENKGFTVTFVGTEMDVQNMIKEAGFRKGNTMSYDGSARGMKMSMFAATADTVAYSAKVAAGEDVTDNFFSKSVVEEDK